MNKMYTLDEVAGMFEVSTRTVTRWMDEGNISYIDIGSGKYRKARFTKEHVQDFIKKRHKTA